MKYSIIVVAGPDQGEGTDSESLGIAWHHQGPTFINAATNLVDKRGEGNDLPQPRRSAFSTCI